MWAKDISRSVDYLETRTDIRRDTLVYFGFSWGGAMGGIMPAVEKRFNCCVLCGAGLWFQSSIPEVDAFNFLPRIKIPVLMLNGKYDPYFPVETSQKAFFELLGTPDKDKERFVDETGHFVRRIEIIRRTIDWLDRYLGPVE
jgi:dienelactone hydrolase